MLCAGKPTAGGFRVRVAEFRRQQNDQIPRAKPQTPPSEAVEVTRAQPSGKAHEQHETEDEVAPHKRPNHDILAIQATTEPRAA